jgi:hypothetical protein
MFSATKLVVAAAILALLGGTVIFGISLGPSPDPSPSPTAPATPLADGPLAAGTFQTTPFADPGSDACLKPLQASCADTTNDDGIRIAFTVPEGWEANGPDAIFRSWGTPPGAAPGGAALLFLRGASLANDPCHNDGTGDNPVGPGVDAFANALTAHPLLDVTDPVDVTVGGRSGKYLELRVPSDPTIQGSSEPTNLEGCPVYRPWKPWFQAQGPGDRWRLWILDVEGVRVLVQAVDVPDTSAEVETEVQSVVDSMRFDAPPQPVALPESADLVAGTSYFMDDMWGDGSPRLILTIPGDGWRSSGTWNVQKPDVDEPGDRMAVAMTPWRVDNLKADPCRSVTGGDVTPPVGPTVDDLVTGLEQQSADTPVSVGDVTLGGWEGKRVELTLPVGLDIATCEDPASPELPRFARWLESGTPGGHIYGNGQEDVAYILDLNGLRAVIDTSVLPGAADADVAELESLVESMRFALPTVTPSASP